MIMRHDRHDFFEKVFSWSENYSYWINFTYAMLTKVIEYYELKIKNLIPLLV